MATLTPSGERVIILLNESFVPPTIFADTNISFGTSTPAPEGSNGWDTEVIATGIPGLGYYGTAQINYTRVQLSTLEGLLTVYSQEPFTLQNVCDAANAQFGAFLDPSDFQTPSFPTLSTGQTGSVTLQAASSSLGWQGQFDVTLAYGKQQLAAAIGNNRLNVLTDALTGSNGQLNGATFMANIDFTSYRDALKPVLYYPGMWYQYWGFTDLAAVQNICQQIGIPAFPGPQWNSQVADYATSQVSGANKNFDRVVVFGPVQGGRFWPSSMYFHYNVLENR